MPSIIGTHKYGNGKTNMAEQTLEAAEDLSDDLWSRMEHTVK